MATARSSVPDLEEYKRRLDASEGVVDRHQGMAHAPTPP